MRGEFGGLWGNLKPYPQDATMDLKLDGMKAAITGGSAGIGKAIALSLAKEGVDVAICARREDPLKEAAAESATQTNRTPI